MQLRQGNSGCKLYLVDGPRGFFVRKVSPSPNYNTRLIAQAKKQLQFSKNTKLPFVVPNVIETGEDYFDMEHFTSRSVIEHLLDGGKDASDNIFDTVMAFIGLCVNESEYRKVDCQKLVEKVKSVFSVMSSEAIADLPFSKRELIDYVGSHNAHSLPTGMCHGDLTFSNMLVGGGSRVGVIDFLDTFYESPIQDIAKIRQDTKHAWWSVLPNQYSSSEMTRCKIQIQELDQRFDCAFSGYDFYNLTYVLFQTISMLRILPYVDGHLQRKILVYNALRDLRRRWI